MAVGLYSTACLLSRSEARPAPAVRSSCRVRGRFFFSSKVASANLHFVHANRTRDALRAGTMWNVSFEQTLEMSEPHGSVQMAGLRSTWIGRRPLYPLLLAFSVSCFIGTLASDIAYWRTADVVWADFSDWLVTVGVIVGYATLVLALIEIFILRSGRLYRPNWLYAIGMVAALILATFDMLVHTRDAWTSVVPWGAGLSALVVVVAVVAGWTTRETYEYATSPEPASARAPAILREPAVAGEPATPREPVRSKVTG
jgi:uncharacterized membrane protein